ncbi:MAG: polysulfide reductase NrfD [Alphaproteobacteria bacterium]|nr:polysulfide reductase NrfD [Alphaproteobacteria bacterium]
MKSIVYRELEGKSPGFFAVVGVIGLFILAGLGAAFYMEYNGHYVTGMNQQIVWGMPHTFAVFLIVAASGALNIASIGSVFDVAVYKPLSRLSGLMALALLAGGLAVLVLDLGRPDRLIVAMTSYNFKSIFAWNVILYSGFFVIVAAYLWTMMSRDGKPYYKLAAFIAFLWRLTLTTGTGSIFGFLVSRQAYNSAIMAPEFIAMSFSFGLAFFLLVLVAMFKGAGRELGDVVVTRLQRLLAIFVAAVVYFVTVQHLTNMYSAGRIGVEQFILRDGGAYTFLFWVVQIALGSIVPLVLLLLPVLRGHRKSLILSSVLVLIGGIAQIFVIIVGGQAYPLVLFPGVEVSSSYFDGVVGSYAPSLPEIMLGLSGIAITLLLAVLACTVLRFLPATLSDAAVEADAH